MFTHKFKFLMLCYSILFIISNVPHLYSQQEQVKRDYYQFGPDERLLITVHIFGAVGKPGEYLVPDDTNLLELISKAGGPTEFSNLSNIKITRGLMKIASSSDNKSDKNVLNVNLKDLLDKSNNKELLPTLQPGDVVRIGKNNWYKWQTVIRVISQFAIVVQAFYWYSRID